MLSLRAALAGSLLFVATAASAQTSASTTTQPDTTVADLKNPTAARLLGIIPGAGHMYAGEVGRGLLVFVGTLGVLAAGSYVYASDCFMQDSGKCDGGAAVGVVAVIATSGLWVWSIVDAGRAARRTNAKRAAGTSLILEPTRIPTALGDDRAAVRLGVRISTP